ncbi:MAG: DUF3375 family protein [Verrucomicrobia bacterium]|nr:DUF3375 family protein [Verrucomicrobiota bacterium]
MPEVWPGLSRPLWDEAHAIVLDAGLSAAPADADMSEFARLSGLPLLALETLRANVEACLEKRNFVLLTEVLERFPAAQGVLEVLGYLILAAHPPHYQAPDQHDDIDLGDGARWRFPRVMFNRPTEARTAA